MLGLFGQEIEPATLFDDVPMALPRAPEPAASSGPTRFDRARDVICCGGRSLYCEEFGSVAGAKRAIAEEIARQA